MTWVKAALTANGNVNQGRRIIFVIKGMVRVWSQMKARMDLLRLLIVGLVLLPIGCAAERIGPTPDETSDPIARIHQAYDQVRTYRADMRMEATQLIHQGGELVENTSRPRVQFEVDVEGDMLYGHITVEDPQGKPNIQEKYVFGNRIYVKEVNKDGTARWETGTLDESAKRQETLNQPLVGMRAILDGSGIREIGEKTIDGIKCIELRLSMLGTTATQYYDKTTYQLIRASVSMKSQLSTEDPDGKPIVVEAITAGTIDFHDINVPITIALPSDAHAGPD